MGNDGGGPWPTAAKLKPICSTPRDNPLRVSLHFCKYTSWESEIHKDEQVHEYPGRDGAARQQIVQPESPGCVGRLSQRLISHTPMMEDQKPCRAETLAASVSPLRRERAQKRIAQGEFAPGVPWFQALEIPFVGAWQPEANTVTSEWSPRAPC
jgi:hypothetical protein